MDIVVPLNDKPTGFLATNCEEYALSIAKILKGYENEDANLLKIQENGREQSKRFSEEAFEASAKKCLYEHLKLN